MITRLRARLEEIFRSALRPTLRIACRDGTPQIRMVVVRGRYMCRAQALVERVDLTKFGENEALARLPRSGVAETRLQA
jgi:hypothetical protein